MTKNPPKWEPPEDPDNITGKYILKHRKPVECFDLFKWGRWLELPHARRVRVTYIKDAKISTVFLGINHDFRLRKDRDAPIVFETMLFFKDSENGKTIEHNEMTRCCTWREALAMHWDMVERVKNEYR